MPIPVASPSKAWVCGRSLAGIVGSNSAGCINVSLSLGNVVCCQVVVSASGPSLIKRSPTECGVSECDQVSRHLQWVGRKWPRLRKEEINSFSFLFISYLHFS